jgi:transcriptional regulator with XRE-family HTH domain
MKYMKAKTEYEFDKTKLRTLRKSRRMSLEEAAAMIGIARAQLYQWEITGRLTVRSLLRVSAAYGVSPKCFFVKSVFQQQEVERRSGLVGEWP